MTNQSVKRHYTYAAMVLAGVCLCVPLRGAPAQTDWMGAAKTILNSTTAAKKTGTLSQTDIASGLREALRVGTNAVVKRLGVRDGFNLDPKVRIPLPKTLQRVDGALSAIGMASVGDDLELRLNRAAEAATPRARELFIAAIQKMTIEDARKILSADPTAATQYLRRTMGAELARDMTPVVAASMAQVGAIGAYDRMAANYKSIPVVGAAIPDGKAQMTKYVVDRAMDGIFYYVGQEEAAIRSNPAKRTTDILKKVFVVGG